MKWLIAHARYVLGEAESHIGLGDNGIRVSAGPFHYTIHWATIGALLRRHVHPQQFLSVGKVLTAVGSYVSDVARGDEKGSNDKPAGSAMGNR